MKLRISHLFFAVTLVASTFGHAQVSEKDVAIDGLLEAIRISVADAGAPIVRVSIDRLRRNNKGISEETWNAFALELGSILRAELFKPGTPSHSKIKARLQNLSVEDLGIVEKQLRSDAYRRYQSAMANEEIGEAALAAMMGTWERVDASARKHGIRTN